MASLATVLPTLLLAAGSLLALRAPERIAQRRADLGLVVSGLAVAASLGLAALAWPTAGSQAPRLVLPAWGGEVFADTLATHTDLIAAACILLVTGLAFVAALRTPVEDAARLGGPMAVAAASTLFIALAGTPVGLVMSWLVLDAAIWRGSGGAAGVLAGQLGLLAALAGLSGLESGTAFLGAAGAAEVSEVGIFLLVVAGMARMGLYPLWWTVPHADRRQPQLALLTRLAPTVAGAYLVLRVSDLIRPGAGLDAVALAAPVIAIAFGALLGWLGSDRDRVEVLGWQTTAHAGLVMMAARLGGPVGQAIALLILVDLVLGRAVLFAAERPAGRQDRWARRIATASLAGLPPTLGFAARWLLYRELLAAHLNAVLLLTVAASALLVPPAAPPDDEAAQGEGWRPRAAVGLLLVLAGLQVVFGLGFDGLRGALVAMTTTDQPSPLPDMIGSILSPLTRVTGLLLLAAVLAPPLVGAVLQRARRRRAAGGGAPVEGGAVGDSAGARAGGADAWRTGRALRLTGMLRRAAAGLIGTGRLLHATTDLVEGRRAMSWTLLAAATVGTMMLASTARPTAPPAPTLLAGLFLVAAWVIAGTMLLVRAPMATLGALAGGYATAALLLGGAGHPVSAIVKGVAGLIVLGILAISVAQRAARPEAGGRAGRLAALRAGGAPAPERLMPSLALALGLALGYGMQLGALPEPQAVPLALLRPALALCAGGILTIVFARTPLRLAGGVLLTLAGFELVYARLDDGLLITGGLAAFQLLFAIVASHFVGTGPESAPDAASEA